MMTPSLLSRQPCDTFTWFKTTQLSSVLRDGTVPDWFNACITRKSAEELLISKPPGYFLIRLSESKIGFSLSYRAEERCRHFMINATEDGYVIVGEDRRHKFLQDLVDFHRKTPIMPFMEVLTVACGQPVPKTRKRYSEYLPASQRPAVPDHSSLTSQHPHYSETVSAPETPCGTDILSARNQQELRRSSPNLYSEINMQARNRMEGTDRGATAGNEDQELTAEPAFVWPASDTGKGLQQEYLLPPPFAPGYI